MKDKILEIAIKQFSQFGVRSVTMEDIARIARISKKTIYQQFKDKKELVREAFSSELQRDQYQISDFLNSDDAVIDHLVQTSKMLRERLSNLNPILLIEVQKFFPDTWEIFETFRDKVIFPNLVHVLERGKELGYFRQEIDPKVMASLRIQQINSIFIQSEYKKYDFNMVDYNLQILDHFLHGIFTEKGRKSYVKKESVLYQN